MRVIKFECYDATIYIFLLCVQQNQNREIIKISTYLGPVVKGFTLHWVGICT